MGYPKKHRGRRKIGSKKEELEKEIRRNNHKNYMRQIARIRGLSLWIFLFR